MTDTVKHMWDQVEKARADGTFSSPVQTTETESTRDISVRTEVDRIRRLFEASDGDKEDLISYAREVDRLRLAQCPLTPCTQAELDAFEGLDSKSKQLFTMWVERALKAEAAVADSSTDREGSK